jgi:hypothetical protein
MDRFVVHDCGQEGICIFTLFWRWMWRWSKIDKSRRAARWWRLLNPGAWFAPAKDSIPTASASASASATSATSFSQKKSKRIKSLPGFYTVIATSLSLFQVLSRVSTRTVCSAPPFPYLPLGRLFRDTNHAYA